MECGMHQSRSFECSKTMVYYSGFIRRRVVDIRATEDFDCSLMMVERDLNPRPLTNVVTVEYEEDEGNEEDNDVAAAVADEMVPNEDSLKGCYRSRIEMNVFRSTGDLNPDEDDSLNNNDPPEGIR